MRWTRLVRLGGLASMLGGVLWTVMFLSRISDVPPESTILRYNSLVFVPLALFLLGLIGLYARREGGFKRAGKIGFALAFLGLVVAVVCSAVWRFSADPTSSRAYYAYLGGTAVLSIGMTLLGVAIVRAKVLTRWNDTPLIIGILGLFWLSIFVSQSIWWPNDTLWQDLSLVARASFGVGAVLLGYALWSYRGR